MGHDQWPRFALGLGLPSRRSRPRVERLGDGSDSGHAKIPGSRDRQPA